jgi:actin-related protein
MKPRSIIRKGLHENIVLSGKSSLFRGIAKKIEKKLNAIAQPSLKSKLCAKNKGSLQFGLLDLSFQLGHYFFRFLFQRISISSQNHQLFIKNASKNYFNS